MLSVLDLAYFFVCSFLHVQGGRQQFYMRMSIIKTLLCIVKSNVQVTEKA